MAALDPAALVAQLEQQLVALERQHDEMVRQLRAEIAALRAALGEPAAVGLPPTTGASAPGAEPPLPSRSAEDTAGDPADLTEDPEIVEAAVEEAVEASLQQTVSRRELFGRRRTDDEDE